MSSQNQRQHCGKITPSQEGRHERCSTSALSAAISTMKHRAIPPMTLHREPAGMHFPTAGSVPPAAPPKAPFIPISLLMILLLLIYTSSNKKETGSVRNNRPGFFFVRQARWAMPLFCLDPVSNLQYILRGCRCCFGVLLADGQKQLLMECIDLTKVHSGLPIPLAYSPCI